MPYDQSSLCCPHDECDHRAGDRDYGESSGMAQHSQLNKIVTINKDTGKGRGMTSLVRSRFVAAAWLFCR